jgi:flagellar assembly protein FliH
MLCRVLARGLSANGVSGEGASGNDSSGADLPVWVPPRSAARANTNGAGHPAQASSAEIQELRSKVEELTSLLDRGTKDAWEQGFRAGDAATRQSLEVEVRQTASALAGAISEIAAQRNETIRRAEADTVRLAIEIARRVLHREITVDPAALTALVGAALEKLRNQEIYRVRIHPDLEKLLKSLLEQFGRSAAIEVIPDANLAHGGVTFEISRGALDASVDTQLREIERGLVDEIRLRS